MPDNQRLRDLVRYMRGELHRETSPPYWLAQEFLELAEVVA